MHSNRYIFFFAGLISVITAVLLAFASEGLKPLQQANIAFDKKTSILRSVRYEGNERSQINKSYGEQVKELVVNAKGEILSDISTSDIVLKEELAKPLETRRLALYVYTGEAGAKYYIIPLYGSGLWGPIWGYISLKSDFNTVYGSYFDHKAETPGLGAEIAEAAFQEQFRDKKFLSDDNKFISVNVVKKSAKTPYGSEHRVDGITGGTITSNGTDKMLKLCVEPYMAYFNKLKAANPE